MLKLNNLNGSTLSISGEDTKIGTLSRNDLIITGRACAMEYFGNLVNNTRRLVGADRYESRFASKLDYAESSRLHMERKLMYCATMAYNAIGKKAPESVAEVSKDMSLQKDHIFLRTMAEIDSEVITPLFFSVISDIAGEIMNWSPVAFGRTKEITILSNEAFLFEDSAWGSNHSSTTNYLYNDTVTLNPTPKTANAKIKWLQMVATDNGMDAGWYYGSIMQGMYSKIMATFTKGLTTAARDTRYVPDYLSFDGYNSANWGNAIVAASAANGIQRNQLFAFGTYQSLQNVLPNGTPSDASLTFGLGEEWFKNGFLAMAGGVPLIEVQQSIVPGTVNTTGNFVFPSDEIFIAGRVGGSLAPMYGAFADGMPITFEYDPSQTADYSIDINVTAYFDIAPIFASKVAHIQNVV